MRTLAAVLTLLVLSVQTRAEMRVGFLQLSTGSRNAAALQFAQKLGPAVVFSAAKSGGWEKADGTQTAPEEFDTVWCHEGDNASASLGEAATDDLLLYVKTGGALLLSGAAGKLLNDLEIEATPLRVLGVSPDPYASALVVPEARRGHPVFAGLDTTHPVVLTSFGGNALADFYSTAGPHGELLADGNAGVGERPVVEYTVGLGHVIFVGWRLPDFTTANDAYRPNLERFFTNALQYLSGLNTRKGKLCGTGNYVRILGVPFLRADSEHPLSLAAADGAWAAVLRKGTAGSADFQAGEFYLSEMPAATLKSAEALGATVFQPDKPVTRAVEALRAEQAALDAQDVQLAAGLKTIRPKAVFTPGPLKPLEEHPAEQAVILGRSAFMAPGDGLGDAQPEYEPVEDGGFRITGSGRTLNRPIVQGQNRLWTGDAPLFRMDTITGNGSYSEDRCFPLWPRPEVTKGGAYPEMGTLRLGVPGADGNVFWLETAKQVTTLFRPGYTQYEIASVDNAWQAKVTVAPTHNGHGMVCHVVFNRPTPLAWQFGGVYWLATEDNHNAAEFREGIVRITEPNLPGNLVIAGCNPPCNGKTIAAKYGQQAEFQSTVPASEYILFAVWGVTEYDKGKADEILARLDTPVSNAWPVQRDDLKKKWFDCCVGAALEPEKRFQALTTGAKAELDAVMTAWDARRAAFQISTPDPHLNALINWTRCTTDYHRKGPGLVLGTHYWDMYSHISTGWSGKEWGGDHAAMEDMLRFYGAMQAEDGFIRWVSPSLKAFVAENNTPYWVDQVWKHYRWTGDRQFLADLWPAVKKAVEFQRAKHDPDGDGLYQDFYEYWNCDSNGKGPKAVAPTVTSWRMLSATAQIAKVLGDDEARQTYAGLADKSAVAARRELWRGDQGRMGCIGGEGVWRGHPQTWEEYLPVLTGFLNADQGRSAMRWVSRHYGYEPQPGVRLLPCSDWWPIRWSTQWVPTGDTCLAALAGLKCGDTAEWWPYIATAVRSCFRSEFPGINMGISNHGAGGGDREDVDSVDPYTHLAVRGIFGIEPRLDENALDIAPAFPAEWQQASIKTPDVEYTFERRNNAAVFTIRTPEPRVKRVRANPLGTERITAAETESVVSVPLAPEPAAEENTIPPPVLAEPEFAKQKTPERLSPAEAGRMLFVDLADCCNATMEEALKTPFLFDYQSELLGDKPSSIVSWWGNPSVKFPAMPRMVECANGVRFLTQGRPVLKDKGIPNDRIILSSWGPQPYPAAVNIPVGEKCGRVWLLLQCYVQPMKNYITNGEIVLHYTNGERHIEPLIPPYNLDCYFQHFSLKGIPQPCGHISTATGWGFVYQPMMNPHADCLEIQCDPSAALESIELRATCSEGLLGLVGLTLLPAQ